MNRRSMLQATSALLAAGTLTRSLTEGAVLDETAIVEVAQGRLQGIRRGGVSIFKGVPYGGRVEAGARFLPAPPAGPWSRTRSALSYGAPSLQNNTDYPAWIDSRVGAENCLFLNVWSPDTSGKRAVMVWIHGGGYSSGSGGLPIYDGAALAKRGDVVVVTVNHRLNIFGYLHLAAIDPHYATSGNVGQLDLVLALQWVAKNISALGGDPANVTLFGESGGGAKISALMAMPAAQGLFHKAIIESGSALSVMTPEAAERTARAVLGHFDFVPTKVEKLQSIPAEKLLAGYVQLSSGGPAAGGQRVEFAPVVDGISIPTQTWTPAAPELSRHIPLLVGTNHDETVAFIDQGMFDPPADDAALRIRIKRVAVFAAPLNDRDVDVLIARYRHQWPSASRLDLLVRISTDVGMRGNAILQAARQLAHGAPVFMYEFDWPTPCFGGKWALHGIEIPFVFGNLDYGSAWDGHDTTAGRAAADPHGVRFRLAAQTLGAWAAFARTGNPSHAGLPTWRPYSLDRRETMALGAVSELQADPRRENRLLIENGLHA